MKKIVVFSVLLALLSAAVFADDEDSGWKVGFSAGLTRDFVYTTKATAEGESTTTTSPSQTSDGTTTYKLGDYIKGSSNLNTFTDGNTPDKRLIVSLTNSGEHHNVYIDAKLDGTWVDGFKFMDLINGGAADWSFSGDTGASGGPVVFDGKVGTGRYGGWVSANEIWDDWIQEGGHNFFGVFKVDGFQASNNISTADIDGGVWGTVYAVGATFGNFKLALGSTLGSFSSGYNNPYASASKVATAFLLSGKDLGPLTFDLFYAVNGGDNNTVVRGTGEWKNLLGAYFGLNIVENLGLSIGYTANFTQTETAQELDKDGNWVKYDTTNPFWSGIDIKVSFSGIEKLGISFNNNISFASVKSEVTPEPPDNTGYTRIVGLNGGSLNVTKDISESQSWFAYGARLAVKYALSDNLGVTLALDNVLTVYSYEGTDDSTSGVSKSETGKITKDVLNTSLHAEYSAGSVTVGLGFNLGVDSKALESENKTSGSGSSQTITGKGKLDTVTFSVPIFFKVSI